MIKYVICLIKAIPFWMYFGVYSPHTYSDIIEHRKDIYVNEEGKVRLADNFMRGDETLVCNATIKTSICVHCGHIKREWIRGKKDGLWNL